MSFRHSSCEKRCKHEHNGKETSTQGQKITVNYDSGRNRLLSTQPLIFTESLLKINKQIKEICIGLDPGLFFCQYHFDHLHIIIVCSRNYQFLWFKRQDHVSFILRLLATIYIYRRYCLGFPYPYTFSVEIISAMV